MPRANLFCLHSLKSHGFPFYISLKYKKLLSINTIHNQALWKTQLSFAKEMKFPTFDMFPKMWILNFLIAFACFWNVYSFKIKCDMKVISFVNMLLFILKLHIFMEKKVRPYILHLIGGAHQNNWMTNFRENLILSSMGAYCHGEWGRGLFKNSKRDNLEMTLFLLNHATSWLGLLK